MLSMQITESSVKDVVLCFKNMPMDNVTVETGLEEDGSSVF